MRVVRFFTSFSSRNPPLVVFGRIARVRPFLLGSFSNSFRKSHRTDEDYPQRPCARRSNNGRIIPVAPDSATL